MIYLLKSYHLIILKVIIYQINVKLERKIYISFDTPLVFAGLIYFGSMWKSVIKLEESNNSLLKGTLKE